MTYAVLKSGADFRSGIADSRQWHSMDSAPRDGSYVELKCTYGVAPWYCIARWTDEQIASDQDGTCSTFKARSPSWTKPQGGGPFDEKSLQWRPYSAEVAAYQDPTGGLQNDMAYWRGAIASKYGLPLDHFEKQAEANRRKNERSSIPWYRRLFG